MSRAGGGKADACLRYEFRRKHGEDMAFPGLFGHGTIEEDRSYAGVLREKGEEVVRHYGGRLDVGIKAAGADTGGEDVPEGDPPVFEGRESFFVGGLRWYAQNFFHNRPEGVPGVGVILVCGQGGTARHTS